MKTFRNIVVSLFFIFVLLFAFLQSPPVKKTINRLLTEELQKSGFVINIESIEGSIPLHMRLKDVSIQKDGVDLTIKFLDLHLIIWRLFMREVAFSLVQGDQITWKKTETAAAVAATIPSSLPLSLYAKHFVFTNVAIPDQFIFDVEGRFRIHKKSGFVRGTFSPHSQPKWDFTTNFKLDQGISFSPFLVRNDLVNIKGRVLIDNGFNFQSANIQIGSDQIFDRLPFPAKGRLIGHLVLKNENGAIQARANWQVPRLKIDDEEVEALRGITQGAWENGAFKGSSNVSGKYLDIVWESKADVNWASDGSLLLPNWSLTTPYATAKGNLELTPDRFLLGTTECTIENLQSLHLPHLYGKMTAKGEWKIVDSRQAVSLQANADDFYFGTFFSAHASLYADLQFPLEGTLDLELEKSNWENLHLESASIETTMQGETWPFRIFADGRWHHPLEVLADGTWHWEKGNFTSNLNHLTGTFFNHSIGLVNPVSILWTPTQFQVPELELAVARASAFLQFNRNGDQTDAKLRFNQIPLDMVSFNTFDIEKPGTLDLDAQIHEVKNKLQGEFKAVITQAESTSGTFEGRFDRDRLDLRGSTPLLSLDLSLPIHLSLWPFEAELLYHQNVKGKIALNGRIEDFLDLINIGPHRFEGDCTCDFRLSNTLYRPFLHGQGKITNGYYQNYYTGTELFDITTDFIAERDVLTISDFTARDNPRTGLLTASGEVGLHAGTNYPFHCNVVFTNLKFVEIDLVGAAADGKIHIAGNASSALATGQVQILKSDLTIPDHIPRPVPDLKVTYKNATQPIAPPEIDYRPYPLHLDLNVAAPAAITISGRGLSSEWKGDFHLGGTYTDIAAKGKLELITGEFVFSSRQFKLTDGALSFSGKAHEMPTINITGTMDTKGVTIIAHMKGPLNSPQITFQSHPPLPLGSIVSYLLFGQDISEITGFQALQLATSLASLAGEGPDIMESTRRALGVDRLRVISDPDGEGGETLSLQVGKYVSKGVLVSLSQGAEEDSTNISVEVDIHDNFVFQIESDQKQEQGKFTIKWNLNY